VAKQGIYHSIELVNATLNTLSGESRVAVMHSIFDKWQHQGNASRPSAVIPDHDAILDDGLKGLMNRAIESAIK
jgi:hypothetical protein